MKTFLYGVLGFVGILALVFGLSYFGLVNFIFFATKYENAKREVYENTQSFIEGKRQSVTKYYDQWRKAGSIEKNAIRSLVIQEFANFNLEYLMPQQKMWYEEIIK